MDPDLSRLEAALRARGAPLVRPLGAPPTTTLGLGAAVFGGGITAIGPCGEARVLRAPPALWTWPAVLGGVWALLVLALALGVDAPRWILGGLVGLLTLTCGGAAVALVAWGLHRRRRRLVLDARSRSLEELEGAQSTLRVPAGLARSVRVQLFENGDGEQAWDVLVDVGFAELWIHQDGTQQAGVELAREVGVALGVPVEGSIRAFR